MNDIYKPFVRYIITSLALMQGAGKNVPTLFKSKCQGILFATRYLYFDWVFRINFQYYL